MPVTHNELVNIAARWLRNSQKCRVVLTERASAVSETPDAIGWRGAMNSFVIECKVSLSDLRQDVNNKPFRVNTEHGMGAFRYFLVPADLVPKAKRIIEDKWQDRKIVWGLLAWIPDRRIVRVVVRSGRFREVNNRAEVSILLSELALYQRSAAGMPLLPSRRGREIQRTLSLHRLQEQRRTSPTGEK